MKIILDVNPMTQQCRITTDPPEIDPAVQLMILHNTVMSLLIQAISNKENRRILTPVNGGLKS